ncbi:MAG: type III PLP-dependent enzyme [Xanthomonadales bacterium]|nr:type III PLP-dependent enzyme [Xanthomonadales bacterium]
MTYDLHSPATGRPITVAGRADEETYRRLVEDHGSPLLVLDCDALRSSYRTLKAALPNVDLYYAIKSLPQPEVVATLAAEGAGFDVATTGELELMRSVGAMASPMIHTHPIKREQDIRQALAMGCDIFVVDNIDELAKFEAFAGRARLLLRVSFRGQGVVSDLSRKFGCDPASVPWLLTEAARVGVPVIGLSFHVGSQSPTSDAHVAAIDACRAIFENSTLAGTSQLKTLDIGGGFPADYDGKGVDLADFCRPINEALARYPADVRIIAEPGRVLSAPCLTSITTVIGRAQRGDLNWYYLDDGVYGAYSGQIYDHARYPLTVFGDETELQRGVLAGPTCDSIDVIAEDVALPPLAIGDLVVGRQMGAYTLATAGEFNSIPKPRLVALNAPQPVRVRRRRRSRLIPLRGGMF